MAAKKDTAGQAPSDELREQLNDQQRITLGELELLGWSLKLVRRPLFQEHPSGGQR